MYRQEHPNPQFIRDDWQNLNGEWDFAFDFGASGKERKFYEKDGFDKKINVPFCPESKLSGIEYKDFMNAVWYMRRFDIPAEKLKDKRVFIHFGAVDYESTIYINKQEVLTHKGGYTSFSADITDYVTPGENTVCVYAYDDNRSAVQPCGKQAHTYYSQGCDYTRTTGIWQTVWLEFTPKSYIESFELQPDTANGRLLFKVNTVGSADLTVSASYEGQPMGSASLKGTGIISGEIKLKEQHLWELGCGRLYDLELKFGNDTVKSYFGLRDARMAGKKFMLNGKSVFQRLVLDQGYYPTGVYTAPSEEDMINDIEISMAAGFNGARLHEKVFEPRFLYHCDRMGYMVWGEYPNWGIDYSNPELLPQYMIEWKEAMKRDFNHPSIIGWCPFNETWDYCGKKQFDGLISSVYYMTKSLDPIRPCIDTSGNFHTVTDIFDLHDYEQNPEIFASHYEKLSENTVYDMNNARQKFTGVPMFVSEYGGMKRPEDNDGWGYGDAPKTHEECIERYRALTTALLDHPDIFAFCYTQLYDIEQEINGLYTYEREPKFDIEKIREINTQKAAIED